MTINRRSFIASAAISVVPSALVADVVKFHPLASAVVDTPVVEPVRPTFLVRPLGQIAHIVQNGSYEWDADLGRELLNRGLRYGPEATSMVFQIHISEARKRWGHVADYVIEDHESRVSSETYPGWMMVCNDGKTPLRLWKDGEHHLSWLEPGRKTAAQLSDWYDRRIDYATTAGTDGREVISSELTPGGAKEVATAATPFQGSSNQTSGGGLGLFRESNNNGANGKTRTTNKTSNAKGRTRWGLFTGSPARCPPGRT